MKTPRKMTLARRCRLRHIPRLFPLKSISLLLYGRWRRSTIMILNHWCTHLNPVVCWGLVASNNFIINFYVKNKLLDLIDRETPTGRIFVSIVLCSCLLHPQNNEWFQGWFGGLSLWWRVEQSWFGAKDFFPWRYGFVRYERPSRRCRKLINIFWANDAVATIIFLQNWDS